MPEPKSKSASEPLSDERGGPRSAAATPSAAEPVRWRQLWPIPTLVGGVGLFVAGLLMLRGPKAAEPDYSIPLQEAERLVESGKFEDAITTLNGPARGFIESDKAGTDQLARYHLARARAFAGAQEALGVNVEPNHRTIIADYRRVESLGKKLPAADVERLARSLIATGEIDEALSRAGSLPAEERATRQRLTRRIIDHNLAAADQREAQTLDLLASLASDPDSSEDTRSWVLVRQSELLLGLGRVEEAITKLLREMQRLRDVPPEREGELHLLLGRAYFQAGQADSATRQLDAAEAKLDRGSVLRADAALLMGRLAQSRGPAGIEQARERFTLIIAEFRSTRAYGPAVLGMAETDAAARDFERSIERYAEVVELVRKGRSQVHADPGAGAGEHATGQHGSKAVHAVGRSQPAGRPTGSHGAIARRDAGNHLLSVESVAESLLDRFQERQADGDRKTALRFAQLAETLYPEGKAPHDVLIALARVHRDMADELVEQFRRSAGPDFTVMDLDPVNRAEVKRHYLAAGEAFRRHADGLAATDPAGYAESLWTAADSFDRAGDSEEARKTFSTYIDGSNDTDPNRAAAKFRLAQVFQSQNDFRSAAAIYEELRAATADTAQPTVSGTWADRSIVPLAACYLADADPENDLRAETLLKSVVDGSLLSPDARDFREALSQLGNMYYAAGRYPDAIVRFEEVISRYGEDERTEANRFKLADSHRLEAQRIQATLASELPQSVASELKQARTEHLRSAVRLYDEVRQRLESRDRAKLAELDRIFLRNAYFYAGDCAYDLGDYPRAIGAYDAAALEYADDPASLVAMVQIVGCYVAQSQWSQARTANERARRQFARFPDEVWSNPDLPMQKRHWERWLEARTILDHTEAAVSTP